MPAPNARRGRKRNTKIGRNSVAEFPKFPLWTDAYLADTTHLTTIEHGAYLLLLITMWRTNAKCLPNDDKLLARYAKLTGGQWARIKSVIMPFFHVVGDQITQGRLTDEAEAVRQHSAKQSDRQKARWLKTKKTTDTTVIPEPYRNDTSLSLSLKEERKTPLIAPPGGRDVKGKSDAKRGSRLSPDWQPCERSFGVGAAEQYSRAEIEWLADAFRDYWTGAGKTKIDWDRTFDNHLRSDIAHRNVAQRRRGSPSSQPSAKGFGRAAAEWAAREQRRRATGDAPGQPDDCGRGIDQAADADEGQDRGGRLGLAGDGLCGAGDGVPSGYHPNSLPSHGGQIDVLPVVVGDEGGTGRLDVLAPGDRQGDGYAHEDPHAEGTPQTVAGIASVWTSPADNGRGAGMVEDDLELPAFLDRRAMA